MMSSGSALNLSLLSRGVGEVKRNGTEKVDVIFEPQDYFNFVEESHERPFFLPPIQPRYGFTDGTQISSRLGPKDSVYLPKTFTTRKGALLLFSEDMAAKTKKPTDYKKHKSLGFHSDRDQTVSTLAGSSDDHDLKTVDDLAKSILAYGSFDESGQMNLKFLHQKRRYDFERQIRPGFSAKRYLSTWTKTWDDTVLEKVISKGYLTEKSLFYYNPLLPHLSRRLNDDMSHYPTPYKLMRSMLMSPGSLSGYTFYRVRPESQESDYDATAIAIEEGDGRSTHARSVKVVSVKADGQQVLYESLDQAAQKDVLTDLLVKSAVHYAMKTQREYGEKIPEHVEESDFGKVPKFDMQDAVESMLHDNDNKGVQTQVYDAEFPEVDDKSQHSGSFKGGKLGYNRQHPSIKERGHPPGYTEGLAGVPLRDYDAASSTSSGVLQPLPNVAPVLPPIGQTYTQLTTIGEASREHTQAFSLPVHDKDDDEDEAWAGRGITEREVTRKTQREAEERKRKDSERRKPRISARSLDLEGPVISGGQHLMSSSESLGPGSTQSHSSGWQAPTHKQQWKGSTQSLRSHGSRKASGSLVDGDKHSNKGSIVFGPDGEMIKVGEAIKLSSRASEVVQDVHDANMYPGLRDASDDSDAEVPEEWKETRRPLSGRKSESLRRFGKRESPKSHVTEQEIIDTLTNHATKIAESVLSASEGGQVLEDDIRTVIQEVMKAQKRNSAGPTVAEYRDQIKGNLLTAISKATGLSQSEIPADAEIDPLLMEQLANQTLTPEDIEIVRDEETGRSFIRSRNRHIADAMGGVEKGHLYKSAGKTGADGKRASIPSERKPGADIGELDIIKYKGIEEEDKQSVAAQSDKAPSEKVPSEVGSKKGSSAHGKSPAKSLVGGSHPDEGGDAKSSNGKSVVSFKDDQQGADLGQAMADLENQSSPAKKSDSDAVSLKSGVSQKSDDKKSKVSDKSAVKKSSTPEKKEEFVVAAGTMDHTKENSKIYGMPPTYPSARKPKEKKGTTKAPAKGKKGAKKGKGKAAKKTVDEPPAEPETAMEAVSPVKELTPVPPKEPMPKPPTPESERYPSPPQEVSDEEEEYIIIRNETMSPEQEPQDMHLNITTSPDEEPEEEQSEADKLRMISNREARAAKRAAAAEKRRLEVERKRREREEQLKREKEEHERQDKLKQELEEQRKRKEEERRLRKQREEEENDEAMREELEKQRQEKAEADKEKRRKEEYAKKLEEMKRRQQEEEKKRAEEAEIRRLEEEERRKEEEELMAKMAEEERIEYERKKKEEEEERKRREEAEKKRREEEAQRALEEARRLAEEMARKQAELEARLRFNRSLQLESNGLEHTQDMTRAFVFSYFELLQWLGLDIPEFELLKLNQY